MELLIILLIVIVGILVLRKPRPSYKPEAPSAEINNPPNWDIPKVQVIEDNSHLKADLAATKESLSQIQQRLGKILHENDVLFENLQKYSTAYEQLEQDYKKLQHQKKSSEVKTGTLTESLLPLSEQFPCNPKTLRFLGAPIDYISFCYETDTITFIEVKSGQSQLNENQRRVKKMVEEGKVEFKVVRLNENGVKVK